MQGTRRGYYLGFDGEDRVSILCHDGFALTRLASAPYVWTLDREYEVTAEAVGSQLTLYVNGERILEVDDERLAWGMAAYALYAAGRAEFGDLHITEL